MLRSTRVLLPLLFVAFGSASCAKSDPGRHVRTADEDKAYAMLDEAQVSCQDAANCHSGIGFLVGVESILDDNGENQFGVGECTAFLIAPDVLATNSHCIADKLKSAGDGADCSGEVKVIFPAFGNYPEERVECAQILKASGIDENHNTPDYAFVKLASPVTDRELISIDNSGLKDHQKIHIIKVDPVSASTAAGQMTRVDCLALHKSAVLAASDKDLSPILALGDCDVIHGNSGSPLFDEAGRARGILYAKLESEGYRKMDIRYGGLIGRHERFADLGFGANLGCIQTPVQPGRTLPSSCGETMVLAFPAPEDAGFPKIDKGDFDRELQERLRTWSEAISDVPVKWKLSQAQSDDQVQPVPDCRQPAKSAPIGDSKEFYLDIPVWSRTKEVVLNRYLQIQGYERSSSEQVRLDLSPARFRLEPTDDGRGLSFPKALEGPLGLCQ